MIGVKELIDANHNFGFSIVGIGVGASILTVLNVLTPVIGILGAIFGLVAGYITLRIKLKEWAEWKQDHPESKKYHKYDEDDKHPL